MAMDFETVRFLRVVFSAIFAVVGGAAGMKYGGQIVSSLDGTAATALGAVLGAIIGWNAVDFVKGRPHK